MICWSVLWIYVFYGKDEWEVFFVKFSNVFFEFIGIVVLLVEGRVDDDEFGVELFCSFGGFI